MSEVVAIDTQFVKEINSAAVLRAVRTADQVSLSEISSTTGLSRQAVTRSVTLLEKSGLVELVAPARSSAMRSGRPAQRVRFRREAGHVLGISMTPQVVQVAVADLAGDLIHVMVEPIDRTQAVTQLIGVVGATLASVDLGTDDIWAASLGTPGIVDPATGTVRLLPSMPELVGDHVVRALETLLSCPVYVDNDIKLATEGERWETEDAETASLVFVHWGTRVGAGIVLNGQLHRGASNDAGDIGYLDAVTTEDVSTEGKGLGRFEAWAGMTAFRDLVERESRLTDDTALLAALQGDDWPDAVRDALSNGSPAASSALRVIAARFGFGLNALRTVLDPPLIIIGGPMAVLGDQLLAELQRELANRPLNPPRLVTSALGDDAVVHGAVRHSLAVVEAERFPMPARRRN